MLKIKIIDIVGDTICANPNDGRKVFHVLADALSGNEHVIISFSGIEDLTARFLNVAIGQLYSEFSSEEIRVKLKIIEANQDDLALLKRVVENAKEFFRKNVNRPAKNRV